MFVNKMASMGIFPVNNTEMAIPNNQFLTKFYYEDDSQKFNMNDLDKDNDFFDEIDDEDDLF